MDFDFKRVVLIVTVGLLVNAGWTYAQSTSMRFDHLTIEEGLSQSTINDILQDQKGFLWFATEDGLNKYDGYDFTVYKNIPGDTTSISDNSINDIIEDDQGNIWIATKDGGLNKFDRKKEDFIRYQADDSDSTSISDNYVTTLFQDRSGVILVGTQKGLDIYRPETDDFLHYQPDPSDSNSLKGNWVTSIVEDHEGILWLGTQDNGLNSFNRETGNFTNYRHSPQNSQSLSDDWVVDIYEDKNDVLWIGTQNGGLNRLDRASNTFHHYKYNPRDSQSLSSNWVLTIFEDLYGDLWVGTVDGLNLFDRENDEFMNISSIKDAPDLENKSITALLGDRSGVFWVGTRDNALYKFVRSTESFTVFDENTSKSTTLSNSNIWAVSEAKDGTLWIGTQGGGVNKIGPDRDSITYYQYDPTDENSLSNNFVNTIYEDRDGTIWIGTLDGLNRYILSTDDFKHYRHDPEDPTSIGGDIITTISQDKTGKVWFGTLNNGLSVFDKETETFKSYKSRAGDPESLSHNKIWSFYEDQSGVFWVGTHGYGLNKYDRANDIFQRYVHNPEDTTSISNNFINFIYQDQQDRYWIGTLKGLNRFYPETETFKSYTVRDGLPNNVIYGIIEDDRGHLWLSTNNGIADFNPETGSFRNYDVGDGLPSNEFRFGAYNKGSSGTMYFGSIDGVVAFEADSLRDNPHVPPVVFTSLELNNQKVQIGENSFLKQSISETEQLDLSHKDNVISFQFSALHYAAPDQNEYAYKLENFDEEWQYIGDRHFVSFTSLPAGDYRFRVKAANKDGIWNEEGTSIKLSIAPSPWLSWWAYTIYGLVGLSCIVGFVQFRIRYEIKKKKRLEEENEKLEELVNNRTNQLRLEKEKSDQLLHNILPKEVADELKEQGTTTPTHFEHATILFADFKGFSTAASSMSPDRLINELNEIFQKFDDIIENNELEKIKTIGDAYMAAGGIPKETEGHAIKCVKAALDMLKYINERNRESSFEWEMRVGLHTGEVIAGVVGRHKFTYDLWGDTVNIASRMESAGEEGKINISSSTHELVKQYYDCEYRGKIDMNGQGKIDMYFVNEISNS